MPAPKFLSGLPKPVLFGLYGAIGGLLGAVALGEPLWRLLEPPPAPAAPPQVAVAASALVKVYPGSESTFVVRVARARFDGPVTVKFEKPATGLTLPMVTVPADKTEVEVKVVAAPDMPTGTTKVAITAATADGSVSASASVDIEVAAAPPAIAVAVPANVAVYKKGTGKFTASVARRGYDGPVAVTVGPLPAGVTVTPATIKAGESDVEVTLAAADSATVGGTTLTITAQATSAKIEAAAPTQLAVQNPPVAPVDVVFVLDVTASMQWAIDDLKNGIGKFAETLSKNQINFRLGLVTFQDLSNPGEKVEVVLFKNGEKQEPFTADAATFRDKVGQLKAQGGGDIPESSLEAVVEAAKLSFRQSATRQMLLITDAPPKIAAVTVNDAVKAVKESGIDSVHLVIQRFDVDVYKPLMTAGADKAGGKYFNLGDVVRGDEGFDGLLDTFGKVVAAAAMARTPDTKPQVAPPPEPPKVAATATPQAADAPPAPTVKSLQSGEGAAAGSEGRLVLQSGVWTGAIASFVCLALLAGQYHYLRGSLPAAGGAAAGFLGGLAVGIGGGAAGQALYTLAQGSALGAVFQVLGWALLGALAGVGLSLFIPNMKWQLGLAGGAIGGAVGGIGFIAVSTAVGDLGGRLVGGLLLGFCIGLMVAVAEAAFRRAWLVVRYGARETITVNLGPEPVKIGGDAKACTVWARGASSVALRFFVRGGQVICDDAVMRRESVVGDGFAKEVGNVTVTVRTGSAATESAPTPPRPAAPPPASAKPAPMPLDDGFDLPMPAVPSRSAPSPPAPKVVAASPPPAPKPVAPPRPPVPSAGSKPVVPAVPPPASKPPATPSSAPKHPDACPGCGRVNAGKPRHRYCMVCDREY